MMDFLACLYLIAFALCGTAIAKTLFKNDDAIRKTLFSLVTGLVLLIWLPALFSFIFGFCVLSQMLALLSAAIIAAILFIKDAKNKTVEHIKKTNTKGETAAMLMTVIPLVLIGWVLHFNHTIVPASNGSLHVGQCTYGDLCMHLGFISSISEQKMFPPQYSLLPGTPLGYPFLCDSVSSTFYTLGASLRTATMLPALYAHLVVVLGVYVLFDTWFKKRGSAVLGTYMFFIGGGLGFYYIFNNKQLLAEEGVNLYNQMLTGFYQTPTNLPNEGLRWVNTIADMVLPQRATLFGWALLFPAFTLLYRAAIEKEHKLFLPLGIIAGALPLVHTHSFVAIGIVSAYLFIRALMDLVLQYRRMDILPMALALSGLMLLMLVFSIICALPLAEEKNGDAMRIISKAPFVFCVVIGLTAGFFTAKLRKSSQKMLAVYLAAVALTVGVASAVLLLSMPVVCAAICILGIIAAIAPLFIKKTDADAGDIKTHKKQITSFILYGLIAVALAAPQLILFTFKQSADSQSFLRWNFNWDNRSDSWLWFYIKNLGFIFILMLPAFISAKKEHKRFYAGTLLIWGICEILLFQPNPYDNNKLLFIWFAFTCGIVADYLINVFMPPCVKNAENGEKRRIDIPATVSKYLVFAFLLTAIFLSGILTLEREYVSGDHIALTEDENGRFAIKKIESGYELTDGALVELCDWVKLNTEPDATVLTYGNHNNAIAMLTGRNIFCGAGTFLHWHGIDYRSRASLAASIYQQPEQTLDDCLREFDIDYILVSHYERGSYNVDTEWFEQNLNCVYNSNGIKLFKIEK